MSSSTILLFRRLQNLTDASTIKSELLSYAGEESKFFKTLVDNIGDDIGKYKYSFDLVLKINRENPSISFHDIYFKYLSTKNFERYRNFHCFFSKMISEISSETTEKDLIFIEDKDEKDFYNSIISSLDLDVAIQLCKDFLSQRALNFEEYYYQVYLSAADKLKNTIDRTYVDANLLYYRNPWFVDSVCAKIYIASTEHDIDLFIEENQPPIIFKTLTWYKPNKSFYTYLSNQNNTRSIKVHENNNLTALEFYDSENNKKVLFSFHILYKVLNKDLGFTYKVFNEQIFNLERKFFVPDYNECFNEYYVNIFLDDVKMFSQTNIDLIFEFFNKSMKNIHSQYKINSQILKYSSLKDVRTLRDLATKIAEITVFLYLDSVSECIFKKRIIRNYYKQEALFSLSEKEKFPELMYDLENSEEASDFIKKSIECEIFNIGESIYRLSSKSMFRHLPKKRVYHKPFKIRYINEIDNHNYIYYSKKEKWLNLKDVLSKKFDVDDEYITDVIYPRVVEIYDKEKTLGFNISIDEFKKKFTLLFSLLDDVLTEDEILEKHRSLFYYYPDPEYEIETFSSASPSASDNEVIVIEPPPSVVSSPPVTVAVSSVTTPDTPTISSVEPPVLKSILKEEEVKEKEIQKDDKAEEELIKQLMAETIQNNSFDLKTFDTTPSSSSSPSPSPSSDGGTKNNNTIQNKACFNCDLESDYLTTKTFQHSRSNPKDFKYISACFDCLEKKTINDY